MVPHLDPSRAIADAPARRIASPIASPIAWRIASRIARSVASRPGRGVPRSLGRLALAAGAVATITLGCHSEQGPTAQLPIRPMPYHPGAGLTGAHVIVLPLETLRGGDLAGCSASITNPRDFLLDANAQIARALQSKAPHTTWVLPAELAHTADRSAGFAPDPYSVDPSQLLPDRWKPHAELADPLASQLRRLNSFTDAPVALIPVELRFYPRPGPAPSTSGSGRPPASVAIVPQAGCRPVLRVAIVDTRALVVAWAGDVVGDSTPAVSAAAIATLADRLAQAVATP